MEEIISDVNATPEQNVDAQPEVTTESVNTEVATPTVVEKPIQSPEENAHFAEQRRGREAAENKAKDIEQDYTVSKTYGEYGVHSIADIKEKFDMTLSEFEETLILQEMTAKGVNPDDVKKYAENLPEVKSARELIAKQAEDGKRAIEFNEFIAKFPNVKGEEIPVSVWATNKQGIPLKYAYADYLLDQQNNDSTKEKANEINASTSMGSVEGLGGSSGNLTEEMVENMSPKELAARWLEVRKLFKMK